MKTTNKVSRLSRYISLLIASLISRQVACWKIDRLKIIYNRSWRLTRKITWLNRNIHLTLVNPALPFVVRIYTILANLKTRRTTTTNEVTRGIDQLLEANALANQVSQFTTLPGNKLISEALRPSVAAACLICGGTEFAIRSTELDVRPAKEDGSGQRGVATGPASSRRVMRSITQRGVLERTKDGATTTGTSANTMRWWRQKPATLVHRDAAKERPQRSIEIRVSFVHAKLARPEFRSFEFVSSIYWTTSSILEPFVKNHLLYSLGLVSILRKVENHALEKIWYYSLMEKCIENGNIII